MKDRKKEIIPLTEGTLHEIIRRVIKEVADIKSEEVNVSFMKGRYRLSDGTTAIINPSEDFISIDDADGDEIFTAHGYEAMKVIEEIFSLWKKGVRGGTKEGALEHWLFCYFS